MRLLNRLQQLIGRTYDLDAQPAVADYVITCPALARSLGLPAEARASPEQVLVADDGETLDLAVYLDQGLLSRLGEEDPLESLHDGNLADFWTALEGVSHFTFLAWSAAWRRQTTRFELELQAEIDKFVLTAILVASQFGGRVPGCLHEWLFDRPRHADHLDASERELYGSANRFAAQYCRELMNGFLDRGGDEALMPELRRFYRLSRARKLRRIVGAGGARS
jgi:hypothetical protein